MNDKNELINRESESKTALILPAENILDKISEADITKIKDRQIKLTRLKEGVLEKGIDYTLIRLQNGRDATVFHRSACEKIASWFNISTEILKEEFQEIEVPYYEKTVNEKGKVVKKTPKFDTTGQPVMTKIFVYHFTVRASLPNGTFQDGIGSCSSNEKKPFDRPIHDIRAVAQTRAKKRAILAIIGAGLSAEEISIAKGESDSQIPKFKPKTPDKTSRKPRLLPSRSRGGIRRSHE